MKGTPLRQGNTQFASSLVNVQEQLYYYALQLTENRDDAQDLLQETNYKALKNISKLKHDAHRKAWLYTILRNTYINQLRSGHKRNMVFNSDETDQSALLATLAEHEHPDRVYFRKELKRMIDNMPVNYSRPLVLYLDGYQYKEIAEMLHVPLGTVKSRIFLAKKKLQSIYAS
jgi:RNA polymerase sigma-70 factor (ECF subfamily)